LPDQVHRSSSLHAGLAFLPFSFAIIAGTRIGGAHLKTITDTLDDDVPFLSLLSWAAQVLRSRLRCARLLPVCCPKWTNATERDAGGGLGTKNRRPVDLRFLGEWS
jgi:hypothetical protein